MARKLLKSEDEEELKKILKWYQENSSNASNESQSDSFYGPTNNASQNASYYGPYENSDPLVRLEQALRSADANGIEIPTASTNASVEAHKASNAMNALTNDKLGNTLTRLETALRAVEASGQELPNFSKGKSATPSTTSSGLPTSTPNDVINAREASNAMDKLRKEKLDTTTKQEEDVITQEQKTISDEDAILNDYIAYMQGSADRGTANMQRLNDALRANANEYEATANQTMDENLAAIERQRQENLRDAAITYERMEKYLPAYLRASGLYGQGISENAMIRMGNDYVNSRQSANRSAQDAELAARQQSRTSVAEYLRSVNEQIAKNEYADEENRIGIDNAIAEKKLSYAGAKDEAEQTAQNARATSLHDYLTSLYDTFNGDEMLTDAEAATLRAYYNQYKDSLTQEQKDIFEQEISSWEALAKNQGVSAEALANGKAFRGTDGNYYRVNASDIEKGKSENFTKAMEKNKDIYKYALATIQQQGYRSLYDPQIMDGTIVYGDANGSKVYVYYDGDWYKVTKQA